MGLLGDSVALKRLRDQVKRIGPTDVSILIYGEGRAGKRRLRNSIRKILRARKSHFNGQLRLCLRWEWVWSLRHFSSAWCCTLYVAEEADGGFFSILLNDVLAMPQSTVEFVTLQEGKGRDGTGSKSGGCSILAANSSDIEKALIEGDFNEELYHYINVLRIQVPSLKSRLVISRVLANHFLRQYSKSSMLKLRAFLTKHFDRWIVITGRAMSVNWWTKSNALLMSDSVIIEDHQLDLPKQNDGERRSLKSIRDVQSEMMMRYWLFWNLMVVKYRWKRGNLEFRATCTD